MNKHFILPLIIFTYIGYLNSSSNNALSDIWANKTEAELKEILDKVHTQPPYFI